MKVLPEPTIISCSNYQVEDLVSFGCNDTENCVITVDPTFLLRSFDVTPITYCHLLLECQRTGKPPIWLGPLLIHYEKSFPTDTSSLVGLNKDLHMLIVFGTDEEESLAEAFSQDFLCNSSHMPNSQEEYKSKIKEIWF